MWLTHISHSVADPHMRENSSVHCVVDPQVKEMKVTYGFEGYDLLTENKSVKKYCNN